MADPRQLGTLIAVRRPRMFRRAGYPQIKADQTMAER